ncbi:replication fork protection component Swi3-domain-containing protein [Thamnidium elegans]|nr:replication fork protection component Swi3-domain-containing protein [Thamnidium elegans]
MDEFDNSLFNDYDFDVAATSTPQPPPQSVEPTDKEDSIAKVKKLKLDEALLLDAKGIPLLRTESRYLNFKGKNHEAEDLRKLMTYYTVWANNLYPKYNFSDFAKRVGTHASHRLVREKVNQWQEEYKEKLQVRRNVESELSGQTVGDEDGRKQEESSDDDSDRPLYIPFDENSRPKEKTIKKVQKSKPVKKRRSEFDNEEEVTKQPRTITFSDDDEEETSKPSAKSGREYALAILAEKRKKRKLAQQKAQEEEEEVGEEVVVEKKKEPLKTVDDIMGEYYEDEIELALSDNELSSLQIPSQEKSKVDQEKKAIEDSEMHDI